MNYLNKSLIDGLASRYVIGSMKGRARLRFQRLMQQHTMINERVHYWEQLLDPLNDELNVDSQQLAHRKQQGLKRLRRRLGFDGDTSVIDIVSWWRRWALLSTAGACVLAMTLAWQIQSANDQIQSLVIAQQNGALDETPADISASVVEDVLEASMAGVAVIIDADSKPLWIIELAEQNISIQATAAIARSTDYDYELWFVREDNQPPVSLGIVPQQGQIKQLCPDIFNQQHLAALAISQEARGGSKSGTPTKVLYATSMVAI